MRTREELKADLLEDHNDKDDKQVNAIIDIALDIRDLLIRVSDDLNYIVEFGLKTQNGGSGGR